MAFLGSASEQLVPESNPGTSRFVRLDSGQHQNSLLTGLVGEHPQDIKASFLPEIVHHRQQHKNVIVDRTHNECRHPNPEEHSAANETLELHKKDVRGCSHTATSADETLRHGIHK